MDNLKIILFICNWGPHAAFQALQDSGADIPPEVSMIRIPCTGSMSKSLLFKAFEQRLAGSIETGGNRLAQSLEQRYNLGRVR